MFIFFFSLELHEYKLSLHTKGGIIKVWFNMSLLFLNACLMHFDVEGIWVRGKTSKASGMIYSSRKSVLCRAQTDLDRPKSSMFAFICHDYSFLGLALNSNCFDWELNKTHVIDNHLCLLLLYLHAAVVKCRECPYSGIDYNRRPPSLTLNSFDVKFNFKDISNVH